MIDKYNMGREDCIFLAKRNVVDYLWKASHIEGINATFADTQAVFDGAPSDLNVKGVITINNLKRAWQFILDNINYGADWQMIAELNGILTTSLNNNAGRLRDFTVGIGGTSWIPDLPDLYKIKTDITNIYNISCETERCIKLMLYMMRSQPFADGNKRTAMMTANHEMIRYGRGIIVIDATNKATKKIFTDLLLDYYETGDDCELVDFIYNNCIQGFERQSLKNTNINFKFGAD